MKKVLTLFVCGGLLLVLLCFVGIDLGFRVKKSVPADDLDAVVALAQESLHWEDSEALKVVDDGDYMAVLLSDGQRDAAYILERDQCFRSRVKPYGGQQRGENGKLKYCCMGHDEVQINLFFGSDLERESYQYELWGTRYEQPIDDGILLDLVVTAADEGFSPAAWWE